MRYTTSNHAKSDISKTTFAYLAMAAA